HHARWTTALFHPSDHDGTDLARRVPLGAAPDRRTDWVDHRPARSRSRRAGSFYVEPASRNTAGAATTTESHARAFAGGQHRPAAVRSRRMAAREAWRTEAPVLAEIAPWRGRRHRQNHRGRLDLQ